MNEKEPLCIGISLSFAASGLHAHRSEARTRLPITLSHFVLVTAAYHGVFAMRRRDVLAGLAVALPIGGATAAVALSPSDQMLERGVAANENCSFLIGVRDDLRRKIGEQHTERSHYRDVTCPLCGKQARVSLFETLMAGDVSVAS